MASAKSLEEMLSSEVDERAVNAFIQSLDSQLSSNIHLPPQDVLMGGNNYIPKQSTASSDALKHGGSERSTMTTNNSQAFCINNVTSSALNDNVVVTLATALPASGYITQVANTQTQSTLMKNITLDGNPEMKIYTQGNVGQLNSAHISSSNRTVIQRNNIKHTNVANGNINIAGQPATTVLIPAASLKTTSQAKSTSVHSPVMVSNVTNPVLVQHPMILTTESQCSINGNITQVVSGIQEQKPQINSEILIPYSKQGTNIPLCNRDITAIGKGSTSIKTEVGLPLSTTVTSPVPLTNTVQSQQHTKPLNVVTQVVSSGSILPGVHILSMCVANSGTTQKTLAPRMGFSNPVRITTSPQVIAARPRVAVPNAIALQQGLMRNALLVRTENGQFQMVNVAPGLTAAGGIPGATTYRLEAVQPRTHTSVANTVLQSSHQGLNVVASIPPTANVVSSQSHIKKTSPSSLSQPLTIQTSTTNGQVSSSSSSQQMSPNTAKKKCKNFLSTLIRLASNQPNHVAANVKSLIQRIIDGVINPEEFSHQLQKELNSSPQPYLIPFLKKNLPYLRHSLMTRELSIEGIRPPAPGTVILPPPQILQVKSVPQSSQLQVVSPSTMQGTMASSALGQRLVTPRLPGVAGIKTTPGLKSVTEVLTQPTKSVLIPKASSLSSSKERERDKKNFASLRDDDDINDVAAMGGVNLIEESQRILATNAEIVGTQIRSCKDETFFSSGLLHRRILKIANRYGLDDVSSEVTALISHAAQERLKTVVEKLGVVVANYVENPKVDSRYEVVSDVKRQIECIEEVDRLHSKNTSIEGDDVLTDPSKVRLKLGNLEETSLQHREKEISNLEAEHETNLTALLAVGPRKRLKTDFQANRLSETNLLPQNHAHTNQVNKKLKRATLRDLIFVMEQDKEMCHSSLLYKAYTK